MKNIKVLLFSLTGISTIGAAFAGKPDHFNGTTYYAISNGIGGFFWTTTIPGSQFRCVSNAGGYCTIVTIGGYTPVSNVTPTAAQATGIGPINFLNKKE